MLRQDVVAFSFRYNLLFTAILHTCKTASRKATTIMINANIGGVLDLVFSFKQLPFQSKQHCFVLKEGLTFFDIVVCLLYEASFSFQFHFIKITILVLNTYRKQRKGCRLHDEMVNKLVTVMFRFILLFWQSTFSIRILTLLYAASCNDSFS